jgi:cysteine synthase B
MAPVATSRHTRTLSSPAELQLRAASLTTALSLPLAAAALDSILEEQQQSEVQTPVSVPSIDQIVGNTPLVRLQRLHVPLNPGGNNQVYVKLEGANPGGSAKDRPALGMLTAAEASGRLQPGGRVIECTTGEPCSLTSTWMLESNCRIYIFCHFSRLEHFATTQQQLVTARFQHHMHGNRSWLFWPTPHP